MKAVVKEGRSVALVEVPAPELRRRDDVIVEVSCAGICRTDLQVASGAIASADPITLGHELCGRVIACGPAVRLAVGDLVTADPRVEGGFLGITSHGAFAEQLVLPAAQLHRIPALDPRAGAYVEPIAAALGVVSVPHAGQRWVVAGDNRFSKLVGLVLRAERSVTVDEAGEVDARNAYDVAIETSGTEREIEQLVEAVRPGGTLILRTRNPGRIAMPFDQIVAKELTLVGVQYGAFERAVELASTLDLTELLGDRYPLARFEDAFAAATASEARKVFLTCAA